MNYLEASATISPCGTYRYDLTRVWDRDTPPCVFVMLNPSTADGAEDDPTIRRCVGFAKAWGHGGLVVVNLFALRATDPTKLRAAVDPVGPENDSVISHRTAARRTVFAWGSTVARWDRPVIAERPRVILRLTHTAERFHLGLTKDGHPKHPLYLRANLKPTAWVAS